MVSPFEARDTPRALIVDDDPLIRQSLREWLERDGYMAFEAGDGKTALELINDEAIDIVLLDLQLPRISGIELLRTLRDRRLDVPVIIVSGKGTISSAVETTRLGAIDFIEKPPDARMTLEKLRRALQRQELQRQQAHTLAEASNRYGMVGAGAAMQDVYRRIDKAARTRARVLILGESGVGKERVSRAIHNLSGRAHGPFVAVNCAAIPESLIEDELFGHVAHAFTDARTRRDGCFVRASGGTLLLDEVGDMTLMTQAKVLRVIEEGEIRPVGSDAAVRVDVRVLAATNRNLDEAVEEGSFREDLFYRLNVLILRVPPLRDRPDDLAPLIEHLYQRSCNENGIAPRPFSPAALALLREHSWPGNVRELQNVIERLTVMSEGDMILAGEVREGLRIEEQAPRTDANLGLRGAREQFERDYIARALAFHGWRIQETAVSLGINRGHLWKKMKSLGIEPRHGAG